MRRKKIDSGAFGHDAGRLMGDPFDSLRDAQHGERDIPLMGQITGG